MEEAWTARRQKLVHDYAITAWMVSPIPEVMADAINNRNGAHVDAVDRLVVKLLVSPQATDSDFERESNKVLLQFWKEHEAFHSKSGHYATRGHIWNSEYLTGNKSHVWHKQNTLPYFPTLGKIGMLLCSKILL